MVQYVISMGIDLGYGIGIVIWVGVKIVLSHVLRYPVENSCD